MQVYSARYKALIIVPSFYRFLVSKKTYEKQLKIIIVVARGIFRTMTDFSESVSDKRIKTTSLVSMYGSHCIESSAMFDYLK